jgi:hypothetical protein
MQIAVTATRRGLTGSQHSAATLLFDALPARVVLHYGFCLGGDDALASLGRTLGFKLVAHRSDLLEMDGFVRGDVERERKPPLRRNEDIVNESERLLAFPRQRPADEPPRGARGEGTWWTVHYAIDNAVPVTIVWPDGSTEER